jgi:hypothetical protein
MVSCAAAAGSAQDAAKPEAAPTAAKGEPIKVEPHRSRWDYPKEVTLTGDQQLHIVKPGDTFWGLASQYLGNPRAWAQIWDLNKWVKDPHWIYPGDPLIVDGSRVAVGKAEAPDAVAPAADAKDAMPDLAPQEAVDITPDLTTVPGRTRPLSVAREELAFSFQDFIQMPYLAAKGAEAHLRDLKAMKIVGAKDPSHAYMGDGEVLYLDGGQNRGVKVGDRYLILKTVRRKLFHPTDTSQRNALGDVLQQVGIVRVTVVNPKGSVAVIEKAMDAIQVGDAVAPFTEPSNMVLKLRADLEEPVKIRDLGRVIYSRDNKDHSGGGDMVIVDKGAADGLQVGDVLLAVKFMQFPVTEAKVASRREMEKASHYLGQVVVVRVDDTSATCRVVRSVGEVNTGDLVTR